MLINNMGYIKKEKYNWKNTEFYKSNIKYINNNDLKKYISNYEYLLSFIDIKSNNKTYCTKANYLISPINFDIFAKYLYVLNKINSYKNKFIDNLYIEHIKSFNNFIEPDGSKNKKEDFIKSFDNLIYSYQKNKIDCDNFILPVSSQNILIDGSHRLSCCLVFNHDVKCVEFEIDDLVFDYKYFKNRNLKSVYLDYMALQIKDILPNTACILIQYDNNFDLIESDIYKYYDVYYLKKIKIDSKKLNLLLDSNIYCSNKNMFLFAIVKDNDLYNKYTKFNDKVKIDILCNLFLNNNSYNFLNNTSIKKLSNIIKIIKENKNIDIKKIYTLNKNHIELYSNDILAFDPKDLLYIYNICFYKGGIML